uniref:hypothetical protein n=1 Tax=Candidatus Stercorousia sp. TaxID=3048886 RepID=UPI0040261819
MITNTILLTDKTPSFGMSVKFNNSGKKFFNKVFENNPNLGKEYINRQMNNKASDIFVKGADVYVGINAKKWKVIGSIWTDKKNGKSIEELICTRGGNIFHKSALKTIIMEGGEPLAKRYGEKGRCLAVAEEIANYQSYVSGNKKPTLIDNLLGLFKND